MDFMDRDPLIEALERKAQDLRPVKPAPEVVRTDVGELVMETPRIKLIYRPGENALSIWPRGQVGMTLKGETLDELMTFIRKAQYG